jgi:GDP-L-fucose synthase
MIDQDEKIFVAGHEGLVGSAIVRRLRRDGFDNLVLRNRAALDLTRADDVNEFFLTQRPQLVFLAAAKVGGIHANSALPADFIRDNLQIEVNVIDAAYRSGARKLLFLGSSCIYPRESPQPISEGALLSGYLEPSNRWYAVAKIAGVLLCDAYTRQYGFSTVSLMPTNLYGPGDNFHPEHSHVLPGLMRRFHEAKQAGASEVVIWGTGEPRREFLHVDDLADAAVFLMSEYRDPEIINVGTGTDISIRQLAEQLKTITGFTGAIRFDATRPDGTPRKLLDISKLTRLGWQPKISLDQGLYSTYQWFVDHQSQLRGMEIQQPMSSSRDRVSV